MSQLSHPLENPTFLSNGRMLVYPDYSMAMVFAFGFYIKRKKSLYSIFGVMLYSPYLVGVFINVSQEMVVIRVSTKWELPNRWSHGKEKEVRIGSASGVSAVECDNYGDFQRIGK